jgi:hypothetical protein
LGGGGFGRHCRSSLLLSPSGALPGLAAIP